MYSSWTRANNLFFYALCCLFVVSVCVSLSTHYLPKPEPITKQIEVFDVRKFAVSRGAEKALLELDMEFDLSSVFNWNVKQLFVYVVAIFPTSHYEHNEVIIFDKIVTSEALAKIKTKREMVKYALSDDTKGLMNNDIQLVLKYETMPYFGFIQRSVEKSFPYKMPDSYI